MNWKQKNMTTLSRTSKHLIVLCYFLQFISSQELQLERRYACWGSVGPPVVSAQCPRDTVLHVVRAGLKVQNKGGSKCEYSEDDCGCTTDTLGCQLPDVEDLCMGKTACRLDVTQQYIDTGVCQGFSDYMFIEYHCVKVDKTSQDVCVTGTTEQASGFLKSPNYPHTYPNSRHCECTLSTSGESAVELTILDLQLADTDCTQDDIELEYSDQVLRLCGDSNGRRDSIVTNSQSVKLVFDTDQDDGDNGFWIKYSASPNGEVMVNCISTYKPKKFIQMGDSSNVRPDEDDMGEMYTAETPGEDHTQVLIPDGQAFLETNQAATENILARTVTFDNTLDTLYENRETFENIIFDENHQNLFDDNVPQQNVNENDVERNRYVLDDGPGDISVKLDEKIRQVLRQNEVSQNIQDNRIVNVIQYTDEENNINGIELEPDFPPDSQHMHTEPLNNNTNYTHVNEKELDHQNEQINTVRDDEHVHVVIPIQPNRTNTMETEKHLHQRIPNDQPVSVTDIQMESSLSEKEPNTRRERKNNNAANMKQELNDYNSNLGRSFDRNNVAKQGRDGNQIKGEIRMNTSPTEINVQPHTTEKDYFTQFSQESNPVKDNSLTPRRSHSYDRISFERDLFEEYTNLPNSNRRQKQQTRVNIPPRQSRPRQRMRPIQRQREERPQRVQVQNHFKPIPVRSQPRYRPAQERVAPTPADQPRPTFIYRETSIPIQKESQSVNRRPKDRNRNVRKNKAKAAAPWWWQYTAEIKKINEKPTRAPSKAAILHARMKNNIDKQNHRDLQLERENIKGFENKAITNDEVPLDRNANNLNINNDDDNIQAGLLLEAEKQNEEGSGSTKSSMTVTAIAVGVISMIVLIVVVGIVVKWVLNKRERKRAMRHRHQKECVMRQQHLRQSNAIPRNLR